MTILSRISIALASLAFPLTAFAAAPDNVSGIRAMLENGKVKVTWNKITNQEIANYRVFYSHTSILKEGGLYDDFETAEGTANVYTFPVTPSLDTMYVSVLAVNKEGEESPYFAEEASIVLRTPASSAASVSSKAASATSSKAASSVEMAAATTLKLLKAEKMTATGVLLTFSDPIRLFTGSASTIFALEFGSGFTLPIVDATVSGSTVLLTTFPQTPGSVYLLQFVGTLEGKNAKGDTIALDPLQLPVFVQDKTSSSSSAALGAHPDVTNLRLRATDEGGKRYLVEASWIAPDANGVDGFIIAQSTDGGRTYGPALRVAGTSRGVSVPHVAAANFGISIRTIYKDGQTSKGIFKFMTLANGQTTGSAASQGTVRPPVGSVTGQNGNPSSLPESGVNIWALLTLTGAAVAWKKMRMQKQEA